MSNRLTWGEEEAILTALAEMLAGGGPQGYDDDEEGYDRLVRNAESAQQKLWARQERRG